MSIFVRTEQQKYACPECRCKTVVTLTKRLSGWYRTYCTNPSCSWDRGWMPKPLV